jgi:glycosyltransferase involved in cell wall biosynthesis
LNARVVITLANIRRVKGLDIFMQVAEKVTRTHKDALFLIVGTVNETDHYDELTQLSSSLGIAQHVQFIGAVTNIYDYLWSSDVFCLLSRSEGFSNALLEAMSCGLPCIATRVGGSPEAVQDGRSGYIVEPEDVETTAARISQLLSDSSLAREMGQNGRAAVVQNFSLDKMISQLVEVYESIAPN